MSLIVSTKKFLDETGNIAKFTGRFFSVGIRPHYEIKEFLNQCYIIGYKSFPLIALTSFIMGLVLTMQLRPSLVSYGVESQLPVMVGLAIVREIGPVITALIFAGKIGSSIGAELGSMKVTEQIDAMEVSGIKPVKYLVATRVIATTLMLPILTILGDAVSLFGAYLGVNIRSVTSFDLFFRQVFKSLAYGDVAPAVLKTLFFGFAVGIVGCYKGFNSSKGTQGVGISANSSVVLSSVLIFIIDLLAVQVTEILGLN
ncbi:MlaE family ABC transporter permease [Mucilaginibacter sp. UYCu711]|jgi:phospholipid/cholesterol/gamma-HCH transport system permease protein|uniref:MlaE family ABC transporter permease n=1 Tax=Mucilaginibacter sp. UYCu711 TaxID=3156339 RepID=UPI003D1CC572